MRATTLPGYGPDGAFVRTLLEIDARALSFAKGDDGRTTADVDVVGMAFDQDGTEVGHMTTAFTVALSADMDPEALREGEGLVYVLKVPIPKPGAYQIRFCRAGPPQRRDRLCGPVRVDRRRRARRVCDVGHPARPGDGNGGLVEAGGRARHLRRC